MEIPEFSQWVRQLDFSAVIDAVFYAAAIVLSLSFHEYAHGLTAYLLGDDTAKRAGRLTVNPVKHLSLSGFLMLLVAHFGWATPVPVDIRRFRSPRLGFALTAAAGPLANLITAFVCVLLRCIVLPLWYYQNQTAYYYINMFLEYMIVIGVGLAVFNLLPVPPLDGSRIFGLLLPAKAYGYYLKYERYGGLLLAVLLFGGIISTPLLSARTYIIDLLLRITEPIMVFFVGIFG